jgi:serine/threonine protein kinase
MRFQCPFCSFTLKDIEMSNLGDKALCPNCGHEPFIPTDPHGPGRIIGDFLLKEKIGEGSIGTVYFAQQISLDRNVALKILSKKYTTTKGMASFLAEARAAAKLSHVNLVQALSVGEEEDGTCYMAMTYVRGESVKDKIKREGKLDVDESLHIIQQIAEALHFAWEEAKLIHRDVKPENIMLDEDGVAKLTDLGLAMQQTDWYQGMEISGSPSYMSPEQFIGDKLDTRSDIYSLGISLYQMLSGKLPFDASTLSAMAKQHFYQKPVPLSKIDPHIPGKVNSLVRKMIEKHPDSRFQNMDELLREIWEIRQETAPDKDFVPDVHTVSIRRLDYTPQIESKEKNKKLKLDEMESKRKSGVLMSVLAFAIPVVLLIVIMIMGVSYTNSKAMKAKIRLVDDFAAIIKEPGAYSLEDLDRKCEEIIAYFGNTRNEEERKLILRMQICKIGIDNMKLAKESKRNVLVAQQLQKENNRIQEKLEEVTLDRDNLKELLLKKKEELKSKDDYISKFGPNTAMRDKTKIKKDYDDLKEYTDKVIKEFESYIKDDVRFKVYTLVSQARYSEAVEMLKNLSPSSLEKDKPWFAVKIAQVERMERIHQALSSGTKYSGVQLEEGRLVKAANGELDLQDVTGTISIRKWNTLNINSIYTVVKNEFKDVDENIIKADISMMIGRPGAAKNFLLNDPEVNLICISVYKNVLDNIRCLAPSDRKKAILKAQTLYRDFGNVPGFEGCNEDLVAIFGKDYSAEEDTKKPPSSVIIIPGQTDLQ